MQDNCLKMCILTFIIKCVASCPVSADTYWFREKRDKNKTKCTKHKYWFEMVKIESKSAM